MKFITRELYQGIQGGPDLTRAEFETRWNQACQSYREELDGISAKLPPGMRAFAEITLHDGIVLAVSQPHLTELIIDVDARRNPWGPMGIFRVTFTGVREVEGIEKLVGDDWLYEEVHLHPDGGFDYRILFWRSDFRVIASEAAMKEIPESL